MNTRTRASTVIVLALTATLVAACAATSPSPSLTTAPSPSPVPTPAPTATAPPRPSATPVPDVSAAFVKHLLDPGFTGAGPITGTMAIGPMEGTVSGSMAINGADSSMTMQMEFPGLYSASSSTISTGGRTFRSTDGGPWFEDEASGDTAPNPMQAAFAKAALHVEDRGIVTKLGRRLHHLAPSSLELTAADLGLGDTLGAGTATIEFFARDDGGLAVLSIGATGQVDTGAGSVDAAMAMDFVFDGRAPASIAVPDAVWTRFTSKRLHYTIGVPPAWSVGPGKGKAADVFVTSAGEFTAILVERQPKGAADHLDAYVRAFVAAERKSTGQRPDTNATMTLLGKPAHRLAYHETVNGDDVYFVVTLLIRGRDAYEILTLGPAGSEDEIEELHATQLGTFTLTGR